MVGERLKRDAIKYGTLGRSSKDPCISVYEYRSIKQGQELKETGKSVNRRKWEHLPTDREQENCRLPYAW